VVPRLVFRRFLRRTNAWSFRGRWNGVAGRSWVGVWSGEGGCRGGPGFFVSYTQADRAWAERVAWVLEEARYRVLIQAGDFVPGSNWIQGT